MKHIGHIEFKLKSYPLLCKEKRLSQPKNTKGWHLNVQKINFYIENAEENLTNFITMSPMWLKSLILLIN